MSDYDPLSQYNLENLDKGNYNPPPIPQRQSEAEQTANKASDKAKKDEFFRSRWEQKKAAGFLQPPKQPKSIKAKKPGARLTTSLAQRNASRRNILHAQLVRKSRKI